MAFKFVLRFALLYDVLKLDIFRILTKLPSYRRSTCLCSTLMIQMVKFFGTPCTLYLSLQEWRLFHIVGQSRFHNIILYKYVHNALMDHIAVQKGSGVIHKRHRTKVLFFMKPAKKSLVYLGGKIVFEFWPLRQCWAAGPIQI